MPPRQRVSERYANIFSADPLLLLPESQSAFGEALLYNLLIYRPQSTSSPHLIDIQSKQSLDQVARNSAPAAPTPDPALIRRYRDSLRKRKGLTKADFDELQKTTMVAKGQLTKQRGEALGYVYRSHNAALASLDAVTRASFANRLRLAAVGYRVKISKHEKPVQADEDLCSLPLFQDERLPDTHDDLIYPSNIGRTLRTSDSPDWDDAIIHHLRHALRQSPDVIVFPEFSLPPATDSRPNIVGEIKAELSSSPATPFVFAGTRHEDRYNRGLIYTKSGSDVSQPFWHYKRAPARSLAENIVGDNHAAVRNYRTTIRFHEDEFTIGVAICYDSFDPTTFLNLVQEAAYATKEQLPKILIVPSYNPSTDFVAVLRDLSFLARCCVVYVNGLHGDAEMFVCGVSVADLADRLDDVRQTLIDRIGRLRTDIQAEHRAFVDKVLDQPGFQRDLEARAKRDRMRKEHAAAVELLRVLDDLNGKHELAHMITIEDCPNCVGNTHNSTDRDCLRDIVYYNLNKELIAALMEFRWGYFGNEAFLPKPFQRDELLGP